MSTFGGRIPELPGIMIDNFEFDPSIKAYFLSHDHRDHQKGIENAKLQSFIIKNNVPIYTSPLTARMLENRSKLERQLKTLLKFFHPLDLDVPHKLEVRFQGEVYSVTVTLTSAEHIMGSVMFLFEKENSNFRCLYTGDFRLTKQDFRQKKCFKLHRGLKPINSVYFDSTWCRPENVWEIPAREEVLHYMRPLIEHHLQGDEANLVCIYTRYNVGYENLLLELANISNSKIHVTKERLTLYEGFPGITDILTEEPKSRLHFCQNGLPSEKKSCSQVSRNFLSERVMKLVFSYKRFIAIHKENPEQDFCVKNVRYNLSFNVCWSTHPSLKEVSDMLEYLDPDTAHANVLHKNCSEMDILETLKKGSLSPKKWHPPTISESVKHTYEKHLHKSNSQSSSSADESPKESLVDRLSKRRRQNKREASPSPSLAQLKKTNTAAIL